MPDGETPVRIDRDAINFRNAIGVHLAVWMRAVLAQSDRAMSAATVTDRLTEAYLFVIAVRHVLLGAKAFVDATNDSRCANAYGKFLQNVPDAAALRDVICHFDAYEAGQGCLQVNGAMESPLAIRIEVGEGPMGNERVWLRINHLKVELGFAAKNATDLGLCILRAERRLRSLP